MVGSKPVNLNADKIGQDLNTVKIYLSIVKIQWKIALI